MPLPRAWRQIAEHWWGLTERDATRLWQALTAATWSESSSLRSQLLLLEGTGRTPGQHVDLYDNWHPQATVCTVELLVQEGVLSRQDATRIEEVILSHIRPDGRWL